jgi:serine/threonine-protein kinase
MKRCPTCGTTFAEEARFCTKDGARLVAAPPLRASYQPDWRTMTAEPEATAGAAAGRPTMPVANEMVGQVLEERYRITRKLGEGGMSYVYLAEVEVEGGKVAIKVLSPALSQDQNAMARLRREADLGGRLAHVNICHIIRLGETNEGRVFIVMPYIEGELLADRTHRAGQLSPEETVGWVRDIAAGLQCAHDLGIVHRDLKPENVMIARQPPAEDRAVVMDFGLAKERKASPALAKLTATGIVLGTPEFMSPEQLRGKPLDGRTDVYSLALMTYEMLTGKLPFPGRTQQEMMINRLRSEPTPLRAMRPDISFSEELERVLIKGMARDPNDRYPTAPAFAEALDAAVRGESGSGGMLGRIFGR